MARVCTVLLVLDHLWGITAATRPNIVFILADDLGWNDVSFHGSDQFLTPNIDALAYSGVILQDYYTQPICTPARAALLTGRHPIHNGMNHGVINGPEPWGLPLTERVIPEYLQPLGYVSRAVGKWHLGFFKEVYTPTWRGFQSHYGSWLGHQFHFSHLANEEHPGYDFHRGLNTSWEADHKYSEDLVIEEAETIIESHNVSQPLFLYVGHMAPHAPLEAPKELIKKFDYIPCHKRQIFAAMVTKVDESVGRIVQALKNRDMLNNSIVIFISDNGGATHGFNGNVASNWPLRGGKDTLWEGGVRGVGLIWSPLLQSMQRVHRGLINVQDWLPTLLSAINAPTSCEELSQLDGVSQWSALNNLSPPAYQTMLHNIDPLRRIYSLRYGKWKILNGSTYGGAYDGHYGELTGKVPYDIDTIRQSPAAQAVQATGNPLPDTDRILALRNQATVSCSKTPHVIQVRDTANMKHELRGKVEDPTECNPFKSPCLFNIEEDPCEYKNLALDNKQMVYKLLDMVAKYRPVQPNNQPDDPRSYPIHWNNTWINWQDFL